MGHDACTVEPYMNYFLYKKLCFIFVVIASGTLMHFLKSFYFFIFCGKLCSYLISAGPPLDLGVSSSANDSPPLPSPAKTTPRLPFIKEEFASSEALKLSSPSSELPTEFLGGKMRFKEWIILVDNFSSLAVHQVRQKKKLQTIYRAKVIC